MRESNNSPIWNKHQLMRPPKVLKELENMLFLMTTIVYISEEHVSKGFQIEGDPTSFEEAMRSAHSSKWLEAMQDEMRSMSTNDVWNLEKIPKGAKTI